MSQNETDPLYLRSHVGRDILQSAQLFRTVEAAVWEYVVNSLQYVDPGVTPLVQIRHSRRNKTVTITDNGSGMSRQDLAGFFTMHGENAARRAGKVGRGKFGTGKSAAFGIGDTLRVETVKGGRRNVAVVTSAGIQAAGDGPIPVDQQVVDEVTSAPNGTTITIAGLDRPFNHDAVRRALSRHLTAFRDSGAQVLLDGTPIVAFAPAVRATHTITAPAGPLADTFGQTAITVQVTAEPLEADERGIAVTVGAGNLVAREGAGVTGKEFGNYLCGDVDVPALEDTGKVAAYGSNRDLTLNTEHPVAALLVGFIGFALEQVRSTLVAEHKAAKQGQEAKQLASTAQEIAEILNADFAEQAAALEAITANLRQRTTVPAEAGPQETNPDDPAWVVTDTERGETGEVSGTLADNQTIVDPPQDPTPTDRTPGGSDTPGGDLASPAGTPSEDGPEHVEPTPAAGGKRPRGGLRVEYEHLGADEDPTRSIYDPSRSAIVLNLDHPALAAAAGIDGGVTGASFKRLSYEVAFTEYALLLATMDYDRNPTIDASDVLFEVRHTLRRITARSAVLYTA